MIYRLFITLVLLLLLTLLANQEINLFSKTDPIVWDINKPIDWNNFEGNPLLFTNAYAAIYLNFLCEFDNDRYTVNAIMLPRYSWVSKYDTTKVNELMHEYLHFKLAQVFAKQLEKELDNYKSPIDQATITRLKNHFLDKMFEKQYLYDRETLHSKDSLAQKRWNNKINDMYRAIIN